MKLASWSARSTLHSLPGASSRAATTARQARAVAETRSLSVRAEGHAEAVAELQVTGDQPAGRVAALAVDPALSASPIITSRHSI